MVRRIMDVGIVIGWLQRYAAEHQTNLDGKMASLACRLLRFEDAHGRFAEAITDPIVSEIVAKARLAHDCGWHVGAGAGTSNVLPTTVRIYCDGACSGNGQAGSRAGFGVCVQRGAVTVHSHSEALAESEPQTNQRAELCGLRYALNYACESGHDYVEIYSDSKYALDCLQTWGAGWEAAGWKKADKKPVLHLDLIQPMYVLWKELSGAVKLFHVRGHTGGTDEHSKGNDCADKLARGAISSAAAAAAATTNVVRTERLGE